MTVLRPEWLLALLPLTTWLLWSTQAGPSAWQRWIDPELLPSLTRPSSVRWQRLLHVLPWLSLFILVVALAGPATRLPTPVYQLERPVVIVLDQSLSMASSDISPSRHVRAQQKIQDWLTEHPARPTGLVVYSGTAHRVAPLTTDHRALHNFLLQLDPFIMPVLGSHPVAALQLATDLLDQQPGDILWFTDDLTRAQRQALPTLHSQQRLGIIVVGTRTGAPVLLPDGSPLRLDNGQLLIPTVDTTEISQLAQGHQVRWQPVSVDDYDLQRVLPPLAGNAAHWAGQQTLYRDWGPYLLLLALPGLLLWWRRGAVVSVLLLSAPWVWMQPAEATTWRDWFRSPDQRAIELLPQQPEQALALFTSPEWQGYAALRADQYERAQRILSGLDDPLALYNLGHALVQQGLFEEALAAFTAAAERAPDIPEAEHNRAIIERLLAQQPPPDQPAPGNDEAADGSDPFSEPMETPNDGNQDQREGDAGDLAEGTTELGAFEPGDASPDNAESGEDQARTAPSDGPQSDEIRRRLPPADHLFLQRKFRFEYERDPSLYNREGPLW